MSITSGFFNSLSGDRRYDAIQISSIFDGIIKDGIFMSIGTSMMVTADGNTMTVIVGAGRAWFDHTWTLNDAPLPMTPDQSEVLLNRIDTLVIDVDRRETVRANDIIWVKGTPANVPVAPTLIFEENHRQYPLADVYIGKGVTFLTQANITNRVGKTECPFITGVLETINIEALINQWEDQWTQFFNLKTNEMVDTARQWNDEWAALANNLQRQIDDIESTTDVMLKSTYSPDAWAEVDESENALKIISSSPRVNQTYSVQFISPEEYDESKTLVIDGVQMNGILSTQDGQPIPSRAWTVGVPVTLIRIDRNAYLSSGSGSGLATYTHESKTGTTHVLSGPVNATVFQVEIIYPVASGDSWIVNGQNVSMVSVIGNDVLATSLSVPKRLIFSRSSANSDKITVVGIYNISDLATLNSSTTIASSRAVKTVNDTVSALNTTVNSLNTTVNSVSNTASAANTRANASMPYTGGTFTGLVYALSSNQSANRIMNGQVQNSAGTAQLTSWLRFRR